MKTKQIIIGIGMCLVLATSGFAAGEELQITGSAPAVDGIIGVDEYSYVLTETGGEMELYVNRTEESLSIAVSAKTEGWVGVGIGEMRMNKATIFIGFVAGAETTFSVEIGAGNRHSSGDQDVVNAYAMSETDGSTYLEIELPIEDFVRNRDKKIEIILAYGAADSLKPYHKFRSAVEVPIAK